MQPTQWVTEGASTPGPGAYYTPQQMKSYLQDLRANRPARPTGSRPPPAHFKTWSNREGSRPQDLQAATDSDGQAETQAPAASTPPPLRRREHASVDLGQAGEGAGKALVQPPRGRDPATPAHERTSSVQYREDARRKAERRESSEIRAAMDHMDLADEEKLYAAARDEAADIVWRHRNPAAPEASPSAPYAYPGPRSARQRPKLQRTRSRSVGPQADTEADLQRAHSKMRKRHSADSSPGSRSSSLQDAAAAGAGTSPTSPTSPTPSPLFSGSPSKSAFDLKIAKASSDLPQQRKTSGSRRKPSGSLFQNPNDHIYEEKDEEGPPAPAPTPMAAEPPTPAPLPLGMRRNPFTRFQSIKGTAMLRNNSDSIVSMRRFDRYEIHKNEPTQSRNAGYTLNSTKSKLNKATKADAENEPEVRKKDGKEVRSDELRAATGFSLRNRSPKLPTPSMVSDAPGRPIVSFDKGYGVVELKEEKSIFPADPKPEPALVPAPAPPAPPAPPKLVEKSATDSIVPTRKSLFERPTSRSGAAPSPFERPTSRSGAAPSPFERPASRSASPFDRPASRSGAASPAPLKELGPSSSSASLGSGRPGTPKGPFANRSPLSRVNTATSTPSPTASTVPPVPADPYALPTVTSTQPLPADPYALPPPSSRPQPPVPSISVSDSRPASRSRFSRPQSVSNVPTISVSETPSTRHGRTGSIPSIGVTPPIPTISVGDPPASSTAPPRGRFTRVSTTQAVPSVSINEPPSMTRGHSFNAPVINLPSDVPTIAVNEPPASRPVPAVNDATVSNRPLPDPRNYNKRAVPPVSTASRPTDSSRPAPSSARTHWTPTSVRTGAQCTHCALSISGRIVSAGGCRFHPSCFSCYQCGEKLECVAFYPEPSAKHAARCSRIRARLAGTPLEPLPGWESPDKIALLEDQDGTDEAPRFYCHLDFHECFSPRCKSCTTPIEGEVVVACGAEWHPGHFFCAQCGDPFNSSTPFVEKDGYAWCVDCHTNRFSAKCKGCRKPVTDTVVKALGAEWHQGCFACVECKGPFDDGRYFLRGESQDPVCVRCEERRLKA